MKVLVCSNFSFAVSDPRLAFSVLNTRCCGATIGTKIIYRHYATLYFIFVVDSSESELGILDLIQTFVESLDSCFKDVCELDLIFNMEKIHYILDEIIQGGMVIETRKEEIIKAVNEMKAKEASEEQITTQIKETIFSK